MSYVVAVAGGLLRTIRFNNDAFILNVNLKKHTLEESKMTV